ncbi:hypothetical protein EfmGK941_03010 [Enterococcus faecium]|nr:hypothetical protein EfmGK941_03010 [Enterococcus faecium]
MAKWNVILSTTEPYNYVGMIQVRQGNKNTEVVTDILQDDLFSDNHEVEKIETVEFPIEEGALIIATVDDPKQNVFTLEKVGVI